jgi:hypothetical protein
MYMKKKDLKKIGDIVSFNIKTVLENQMNYAKVDKAEEYKTSAYDETVSNKFKKLVLNLLDYSETLNININDNSITISANDVKSIKRGNTNSNTNSNQGNGQLKLQDESNYLEISITKEKFVMNKGYYNRACYKDTFMYDYFQPILSKKLQEINAINFNNVWDDIMKDSGMIRDNNLLELFNEIDLDE